VIDNQDLLTYARVKLETLGAADPHAITFPVAAENLRDLCQFVVDQHEPTEETKVAEPAQPVETTLIDVLSRLAGKRMREDIVDQIEYRLARSAEEKGRLDRQRPRVPRNTLNIALDAILFERKRADDAEAQHTTDELTIAGQRREIAGLAAELEALRAEGQLGPAHAAQRIGIQSGTFSDAIFVGPLEADGKSFATKLNMAQEVIGAIAIYVHNHHDGELSGVVLYDGDTELRVAVTSEVVKSEGVKK
jgi:hypothetical protein